MARSSLTLPLLLALSALAGCAPSAPPVAPTDPIASFSQIDSVQGSGPAAQPGQKVSVHYTGWLFDADAPLQRGSKFDSSLDRGQPFTFTVGAGQVIRGWDEGVAGMQVGGKRTLMIPPGYGYGARAMGPLPANASLVFDVELLKIQDN